MAQRIIEVTLFVDVDIESDAVTVESYEVAGGTSADLQTAVRAMDAALPQMSRDAAQGIGCTAVANLNWMYIRSACHICGAGIDPGTGVCELSIGGEHQPLICNICADQLTPGTSALAETLDQYDHFLYDTYNVIYEAVDTVLGHGVSAQEYTPPSLVAAITQALAAVGAVPPTIDNPRPEQPFPPDPIPEIFTSDSSDIPF